jgi:hypothetical protein
MKNLSVLIYLSLFFVCFGAIAQTSDSSAEVAALEGKILADYNVRVARGGLSAINHTAYAQSLRRFIAEAERRQLGRRFMPPLISYQITERDDSVRGNTIASRLGNEAQMVDHALRNFPAEGSPQAEAAERRMRLVRLAIVDRLRNLADQGVTVTIASDTFGAMWANSDSTDGLSYFRQEDLLLGLIRLQTRITAGQETATRFHIVDKIYFSIENNEFNYAYLFQRAPRRDMEEFLRNFERAQEGLRRVNLGAFMQQSSDSAILTGAYVSKALVEVVSRGSSPAPVSEQAL